MTKLQIVIDRGPDAKPDECGRCEHWGPALDSTIGGYCGRLGVRLPIQKNGATIRDRECLAAEVTDGYVQSG